MPFITYDTKRRLWCIGEEAKEIISKINTPIAVIAVAGLYRTGKSFVMNRLLDRQVSISHFTLLIQFKLVSTFVSFPSLFYFELNKFFLYSKI